MFNISATELLVIAVVALLVLGPDKLPDAMRKLGRATREIRRLTSGFEAELRDALSEPVETPKPTASESTTSPTDEPAAAARREPDGGARQPDAIPEPAPSTSDASEAQPSPGETAA